MSGNYQPTEKTKVQRIPKRGTYDREVVHSIIDQSILCHVGVSVDGVARVIPTAILRIGEFVYLHGSNASQLLRSIASGTQACITVSIIDSLVAARSGFHCAVDYRSVVIFGTGEEVSEPTQKEHVMDLFVQHMLPGHTVRRSKAKELNATTVLRIPLIEVSAKVRDTGVGDFEDDLDLDLWAGVIPLRITAGEPRKSPLVKSEMPTPAFATNFNGWGPVDPDIDLHK